MTTNIVSFVVVLGVLIFVHELGHFLIARLFKVGVEKFSLGFGPKLVARTVGMTEYRISAFPLGGYVKMVGEDPDSEVAPHEKEISFTHKPVWQRTLIVAAGPFFNVLLAVVIFFSLLQVNGVVMPLVGEVTEGSAADAAGIRTGDLVLAIDGKSVRSWDHMVQMVRKGGADVREVKLERNGRAKTVAVQPVLSDVPDEFGDTIEAYDIGAYAFVQTTIGSIFPESAAERAGLQPGDEILKVDGRIVADVLQFIQAIKGSGGKPLELVVRRDGALLAPLTVTPAYQTDASQEGEPQKKYMIGAGVEGRFERRALGPREAAGTCLVHTARMVRLIGISVVKIVRGTVSRKEIGGPIRIAQMAGQQARKGILDLLSLIAFISINLAILNILPIPVLDGGHLLFFLIEAVRGRPVSTRVREIAQQGGMIVLLMLMMFVFYNDITNIFFSVPR